MFSLGFIKEKLRMTVYKAVILQQVGNSKIIKNVSTIKEEIKFGKTIKTETIEPIEIDIPKYRVVKVKHVNPSKEYFNLKIQKVKKALPIDFSYEAYYHNEKHVMLIDWDTGRALKMGGGLVEYAYPPKSEAMKNSLMRSVGELIRGKQQVAMVLMALGLGVFLGMFIQGTLIPLLEGMG